MEKAYAQAIEALKGKGIDDTKIVADLMAHLKESGRTKLLPKILRELAVLEARREKLAPSLEVASEGEKAAALKAAKEAGIAAGHARVNHALITGWRGRSGSTLIDRSGKRSLIELYRKVTG